MTAMIASTVRGSGGYPRRLLRGGTPWWKLASVAGERRRPAQSNGGAVEESLRRDLKLDVLDELWSKATLSESKASELALEAQHATRPRARASGARRR